MVKTKSIVLTADWNGVPAGSVMNIILIDDSFTSYNPADAGDWPGAALAMRDYDSADRIVELTPAGS